MTVQVVQYKWAGSWGPFRIASRCGQCNVTEGVIRDVLDREFPAMALTFEARPWLDHWWRVLGRGGWHAPIVTVNGRVIHQGSVVDRGVLAAHIRRELVADYEPQGNVVFYKDGCPYCARAKQVLDEVGVAYEKRNVITDPLATLQLFHAAKRVLPKGRTITVPQVWLGGTYFGDSQAVVRAHETGQLARYAQAV